MRGAIAGLRAADREVIFLVVWDGLDNDDVARVLGCSTNAVAVRLHRARRRLGELLSAGTGMETVKTEDVARINKEG